MLSAGIDLVEIGRIEKSMKNPCFCRELLGGEEYALLARRGFPPESVAASFCAKEALSKAFGTGLKGFSLAEAELLRSEAGKPFFKLSGRALSLSGGRQYAVSVTHTARYAAAVVVAQDDTASDLTRFPREASGMARGAGENDEKAPEQDVGEISMSFVTKMLRPRAPESSKGDYGRLLCVCGSEGMAGAAAMSVRAALRCGAGIVEAALPRCIYPIVASLAPEAVFTLLDPLPEGEMSPSGGESLRNSLLKANACLIGCGLGVGPEAAEEVETLIGESRVPLIIDADGINLLARNINILKTAHAPVVLTPHPGEMARLLGTSVSDVQAHRREYASKFAAEHHAVLVLKGAGTLVALPDGRLYRNTTGNAGMAKGGSGDVLAGMTASFAAQGIEPGLAAAGAVYLHGLAGDRCAECYSQTAMLPTDMIEMLPTLFSEIGR